ncbi:MAG TPA: hypothetical protein VK611_17395 [Acidimicrobiales bacterium]|nr:hypothetical protein [Acidimicrobiales bacterium]
MGDVARRFWRLLEPIHGVVYFAPDARARFDAVGLRGFGMGYFASRSAALGPVGPEVVTAAFYVFEPSMVARALPDAWTRASPEAVLAARAELADVTLRGALGPLADGEEVAAAAEVAIGIAREVPIGGRPLAAAHRALPIPPDARPLARLWWAATVLREHRGDGHVAALLTADVDPCAALVLAAAAGAYGEAGAKLLQTNRRWSDEAWAAATARLAGRGWLDDDGTLTAAGVRGHQRIEDTTDRLAATAYASTPADDLDRLAEALRPLAARIADTNALPYPNPIGVDPRPGP